MKKKLVISVVLVVLVIIICALVFRKSEKAWEVMDGEWMVNETSSYSVDVKERNEYPWEDIYVYNSYGNLVFSLENNDEPQYLFALYDKYLVLDSWTSASQRGLLVYDIENASKVFETDYYPWENWLVLNDNNITFYKEITKDLYWDYSLPSCQTEYDNGYIENYWYTIWEDQANDLGDIQCAYFE